MHSAIYQGRVTHVRPERHRLNYPVFMMWIDIDELPRLDRTFKLFGHNRLALLSLFDRDHANRRDQPLRPQIEKLLRDAGLAADGGAIRLLTMPRVLNYVFNPLSVFFCYRRDGALQALAYEVSNTFGERHFYVFPATGDEPPLSHACDKNFFVSPFLEHHLRYAFKVAPPGERVAISITAWRSDAIALAASFTGARRELGDLALARAWAGNPLMTFMVIAGIHWEALKMMAKGIRYLGRGDAARTAPRRQQQP